MVQWLDSNKSYCGWRQYDDGDLLLARGRIQWDWGPVWPVKNRQMSIKMPKNDFTSKIKDFDTLQKLPKNVRDLGKLIVAKGFEKLPKVQ